MFSRLLFLLLHSVFSLALILSHHIVFATFVLYICTAYGLATNVNTVYIV